MRHHETSHAHVHHDPDAAPPTRPSPTRTLSGTYAKAPPSPVAAPDDPSDLWATAHATAALASALWAVGEVVRTGRVLPKVLRALPDLEGVLGLARRESADLYADLEGSAGA